ncbi:hypothetical protein CHH78_21340 [Shouchella clausii]|uniref:Uncharacterized protein n=1 Tax=Shouchella clausii TaxID=79880 RepID=A0A268RUQ3_SHOCL|nr:hypothetical protein CHH76_21315 [Shouchella clausii]PAD41808.1 hypothetical protein CHH54_15480 [Bacillus sp. 7520-S]PAD14546.1 hypothetical protein CHH74_08665 [Shouchella clausii]PAE78400.1 hypothetical protein CHH78_21340 [Shouchella clausii]PAE96490.1 hypothetical protein CHH71_12630 [Shouchella clausii]
MFIKKRLVKNQLEHKRGLDQINIPIKNANNIVNKRSKIWLGDSPIERSREDGQKIYQTGYLKHRGVGILLSGLLKDRKCRMPDSLLFEERYDILYRDGVLGTRKEN